MLTSLRLNVPTTQTGAPSAGRVRASAGVPPAKIRQATATADNSKILRFARSERMLHWAIAGPFLFSFATAAILVLIYNPDPSRPFRSVFAGLHRISGVALIVLPMLATLKSRGDARIHFYNVKQAWTWMYDDFKWLALMGLAAVNSKIRLPEQGKFNAAEKLNFMVLMTTYPLYVVTGLLMWLTHLAILSWILHFMMALLATPLLLGHLFMALINPSSRPGLQGMISGFVDRQWAKHHYRRWYREHYEEASGQPSRDEREAPSAATVPAGDEPKPAVASHAALAGNPALAPKAMIESALTEGGNKTGDGGILEAMDFTSILSMNWNQRRGVLAALRKTYNGKWARHVGTGGRQDISWDGRLDILVGAAEIVDSGRSVIAALGDRFLYYRIDECPGRLMVPMVTGCDAVSEESRFAVPQWISTSGKSLESGLRPVPLPDAEMEWLEGIGLVAAITRNGVLEKSYRGNVFEVGLPEPSGRISAALVQLFQVLHNLGCPPDEARRLVRWIALDCIPQRLDAGILARNPRGSDRHAPA